MSTEFKQRMLKTALGPALLDLRAWQSLLWSIRCNPEMAGCVANDFIADRLITRLCASHRSFVDVGAHIGSILSRVHRHDPAISILAFEAEPNKAEKLRKSFAHIQIFEVAVGEREGQIDLVIDQVNSGYNSIVGDRSRRGQRIPVRMDTLDNLVGDRDVDVMKVDVEGAELGVFRGARDLLARTNPTLMFESVGTGENALGYSAAGIWDLLHDHHYGIFTPDRVAHDAKSLARDAFLDCHQYPFRSHNYFAIHTDRREEVRSRAREILGIKT